MFSKLEPIESVTTIVGTLIGEKRNAINNALNFTKNTISHYTISTMHGITFIENFIEHPTLLFNQLQANTLWDERMATRKTASYGKAYNYAQMSYPFQAFPIELEQIITLIDHTLHFKPNNCLINYYLNGQSKMGFHSDQTDILEEHTGVGIVSIGATRILRFRNIADKTLIKDFELPSGSFIYMTNAVQAVWQHAIPKAATVDGRMSLTFRKVK